MLRGGEYEVLGWPFYLAHRLREHMLRHHYPSKLVPVCSDLAILTWQYCINKEIKTRRV